MALSRSSFVPLALQGRPENVLALMYIASAVDLPIATIWQNVYATGDGDVGYRSRLLHQLMRRAGHRLVWLDCDEDSATALLWLHGETRSVEVTYTMDEATRLGLTEEWRDRDRHWQRQPAQMLRNRLVSKAVNHHCPEIKGGIDWSEDGGLLVAGLAEGDEQEQELARFAGLGPEVVRLLTLTETIDADETLDPVGRVTALRGVWAEARLLLDVVVDEAGTTLGGLVSQSLTQSKAAVLAAAGGKRSRKKDPDEAVPLTLPCGCVALEVTTSGAHGCAPAPAGSGDMR